MKQTIIIDRKQYFFTDGNVKEKITAKQADKLFRDWKAANKPIHRKYGMGGKVTWVWTE